jgi:hypothetical protein
MSVYSRVFSFCFKGRSRSFHSLIHGVESRTSWKNMQYFQRWLKSEDIVQKLTPVAHGRVPGCSYSSHWSCLSICGCPSDGPHPHGRRGNNGTLAMTRESSHSCSRRWRTPAMASLHCLLKCWVIFYVLDCSRNQFKHRSDFEEIFVGTSVSSVAL